MKILLSPAKSLRESPAVELQQHTVPVFIDESERLAAKLARFSTRKLSELMHISKDLAVLNKDRYAAWQRPDSRSQRVFQSALQFDGEVYRGLDFESMPGKSMEYAQQHLRILSGLYGILKPFDLMYPYRLEMGTKWQVTPKTKNLYAFWGTKVSDSLNREMEDSEPVLNLASAEYFKVIDPERLRGPVITPVFKDFKNGEFKVIMMYAKHARGVMARYCCTHKISDVEALKGYSEDGYEFDARQSTDAEWVFVR